MWVTGKSGILGDAAFFSSEGSDQPCSLDPSTGAKNPGQQDGGQERAVLAR
jgi:hypothetical protein